MDATNGFVCVCRECPWPYTNVVVGVVVVADVVVIGNVSIVVGKMNKLSFRWLTFVGDGHKIGVVRDPANLHGIRRRASICVIIIMMSTIRVVS